MFSDTTLNRIYDRGSSVYNYSLGGEGFTEATKRRTDTRNQREDSPDNFVINYEPTIEIIERDGKNSVDAENRGQRILDDASIPEIEHAVED